MSFKPLKVGELANRTGLTVRALHHYHHIGLLRPSLHTEGEYRLYTEDDIARLQLILSLRKLDFSLDEIRNCLDSPTFAPLDVIRRHLARIREQIELQHKLCERLEGIAAHFGKAEEVSADEFLQTIKVMTMIDIKNYFTAEQLEFIQSQRDAAGDRLLRQKQDEWAELIAEILAEKEAGTDPAEAKVQALAVRWQIMVRETTGGDPNIEQSLKRLWDEQGDVIAAQHGARNDPRPVFDYIAKAIALQ
jgi:DNA-binding transcriptional MerR regulator